MILNLGNASARPLKNGFDENKALQDYQKAVSEAKESNDPQYLDFTERMKSRAANEDAFKAVEEL